MSFEFRLCREIMEEEFGPFPAKVAHQVLLKGRLTLRDIIRFTKLTQRQVRESLTVLIQHGICYFTDPADTLTAYEPTFYLINSEKILLRLRMGAILRISEERFGKEGKDISELMFLNGRMTIDGIKEAKKDDPNVNVYIKTFTNMAYHKFITAVLPEHSRSAMDRLLQAEEKEAEKYTITTTKELQAIKKAAQAQVEAEINMGDMVGMKRKAADPLGLPAKRHTSDARNRKMEDASDTIEIDNMVYFNINYEQFNMIFRNDAIVDFATERINRTAGQVLKGFLDFAKDKMKSLKEDDTPAATPMHIANILAPDLLTQGDIVLQQDILDSHSNRKPSTQETLRGYINLLKLDQSGFLKTRDDLGSNQYSINLYKLRLSMKRKILETLLRERLGVATCRIVRILIEKGKLDESQVQKLAMLPPKDTREKLALLHLHGFVEIQEVPRSADRAPGRSFHLWYVPLEKCYEEILVDIYRVLGNLQQRKKNELAIRSRLLEKLNRKDVIENMDLLSDGDKAEKDNMEKVLARLETSIARLDSMVMILRDF